MKNLTTPEVVAFVFNVASGAFFVAAVIFSSTPALLTACLLAFAGIGLTIWCLLRRLDAAQAIIGEQATTINRLNERLATHGAA